jgi:sigma-B regulation protein RsbU (phosphoserine phosphatase)
MDTTTGELRYANAGHPSPLLLRRNQGEVVPLPLVPGMPGPPLGVRHQAAYTSAVTTLAQGDLLLLFTDGLFEVAGADQEPFGEARLEAAVRRRIGLSCGRLFDEILAEVQQFSAGRGFADDVCLVGMEVVS